MTTKNKIQYGKVEVSPEEFQSKNVKERITIFLDEDVVDRFRARAKASGLGYQTLINQTLRSALFPHEGPSGSSHLIRASESDGYVDMEAVRELVAVKDELLDLVGRKKAKKRV